MQWAARSSESGVRQGRPSRRGFRSVPEPRAEHTDRVSDALLDALDRLRNTGPEFDGFLANHGPMAAEAG